MFDSAVVRFGEQWKLKTLADTTSSIPTPVQGYAWWIQSYLETGEMDYTDALTLWALRN